MIRLIDGQEVLIICLNEECKQWDDTHSFFCNIYTSSNEVIGCPNSEFKTGYIGPVKPWDVLPTY